MPGEAVTAHVVLVIVAVTVLSPGRQEPPSPAARDAERRAARAKVEALVKSMKTVAPSNAALAAELREIRGRDQLLRLEGMRLWNEKGTQAPEAIALWKKQGAIDAENQARLDAIVATHGWPGVRLAGLEGADAAFLVVDHAPPEYQKKHLPALRKATAAGDAPPMWAAMLEDRVRMGDKLPQRYGTQVHREPGWTTWRLWPIEDESRVDDRRAAVGFEPLAEYLKNFGITYRPK